MTTDLSGRGDPLAPKKPSKLKLVLIILAAVFIGGPLALTIGKVGSIKPDAAQTAADAAKDGAAKDAAANAPAAQSAPANWEYGGKTDAMTNSATLWACATSTNQVKLDFPYKSQATELCARHGAKGSDVYVRLPEGGQFNCSIVDGCRIRVKFDDGAIQNVTAVTASDGSNDVVFLRGEAKLVAALKTAKSVIIEAEFFQAGTQQMTFKTEGFDAAKAGFTATAAKK